MPSFTTATSFAGIGFRLRKRGRGQGQRVAVNSDGDDAPALRAVPEPLRLRFSERAFSNQCGLATVSATCGRSR